MGGKKDPLNDPILVGDILSKDGVHLFDEEEAQEIERLKKTMAKGAQVDRRGRFGRKAKTVEPEVVPDDDEMDTDGDEEDRARVPTKPPALPDFMEGFDLDGDDLDAAFGSSVDEDLVNRWLFAQRGKKQLCTSKLHQGELRTTGGDVIPLKFWNYIPRCRPKSCPMAKDCHYLLPGKKDEDELTKPCKSLQIQLVDLLRRLLRRYAVLGGEVNDALDELFFLYQLRGRIRIDLAASPLTHQTKSGELKSHSLLMSFTQINKTIAEAEVKWDGKAVEAERRLLEGGAPSKGKGKRR